MPAFTAVTLKKWKRSLINMRRNLNLIINPYTIDHVDHAIKKFLIVRPIDPITSEKVISMIQNFHNRKAPGNDEITNSATTNLAIKYDTHIANLINAIFHFRYFSFFRKKIVIVPVKKIGGAPTLAKSFRTGTYSL